MKISKHSNFLNSIEEYKKAKYFWKNLIDNIAYGSSEYVDNKFSNGIEILDGNPIYTAKFENNIAIRIIQNKNTLKEPVFTFWIQKSLLNDNTIDELVLYLQPLDYIIPDVKLLIKLHIEKKISINFANKITKKYQVIWDKLRSRKIVNRLERQSIFTESIKDDFIISKESLKQLSNIVKVQNLYVDVPVTRVSNPVSKALYRVETRIQNLNKVITLKGNLVMNEAPKIKTYNNKIKTYYSTKNKFNKSIISKINILKEEVNKLKLTKY